MNLDNDYLAKIRIWCEEYGFFYLVSTGNDFEWESDITDDDIPDRLRQEISQTLESADDEEFPFFPEMEWIEDKCIKRAPSFTTSSGFTFKAWFFEYSDTGIASYT